MIGHQAPRHCNRCKTDVAWRKDRPPGARCSRRLCLACGAPTHRIKGQRKKATMPAALLTYRQQEKACDELWRHLIYHKTPGEYVRSTYVGICVRCGQRAALQAAHAFKREKKPTRHAPDGGLPLCAHCHLAIENDYQATRDLFVRFIGAERWMLLEIASKQRGRRIDLVLVRIDLESRLKAAQARTTFLAERTQ